VVSKGSGRIVCEWAVGKVLGGLAVHCVGSLWEQGTKGGFLSSGVHAAGIAGALRFTQDGTAYFLGLLFVIPRLDSHPHCKCGYGRSIVLAVEDFPTSRAREEWGTWKFPFGPVVTDASTGSFDCAAAALCLPLLRSG